METINWIRLLGGFVLGFFLVLGFQGRLGSLLLRWFRGGALLIRFLLFHLCFVPESPETTNPLLPPLVWESVSWLCLTLSQCL